MERLTDKREADAQRKEYENRLKNGYPRNIPEERFLKLAAYKDTGLKPEEIKTEPYGCVFYCNRKCNLDDDFCAEGPGCPHELRVEDAKRLLELSQAEKDGRLVVLPVYPYLRPVTSNEVYICEDGCVYGINVTGVKIGPNGEGILAAEYETLDGDVFWDYDIGKTVFLTEEAEAALKKREDEQNDAD